MVKLAPASTASQYSRVFVIGLFAGCSSSPTLPATDRDPAHDRSTMDADVLDSSRMSNSTMNGPMRESGMTETLDAGPSFGPLSSPPVFPRTMTESISAVTVVVRTDSVADAATDSNEIRVCVSAEDCFLLDNAGVDELRTGEVDVFQFETPWLTRSDLDRVVFTSSSGSDAWKPACLQVLIDGEPIYCSEPTDLWFGNASDETTEFAASPLPQLECTSCYPDPITHGPMLGAVDSTTARLWLRTDRTRRVELWVAPTTDRDAAVLASGSYPLAQDDFTTVLHAEGMLPNHTYTYWIAIDGVDVHTGSFSTAPAADSLDPLRFAFGSCARDSSQPIFDTIQSLDPDLFLFVGDNHYGNTNQLQHLRFEYRAMLEIPERASLVSSVPTLAIWDDHDFVGNNTNGNATGKENALRAFTEYWANPSYGTDETPGVFHRLRRGGVEFFMLDDRYYRGFDGSVLGAEQTAWLLEGLRSSDATFKFLVCGSQWTEDGSYDSWASHLDARNEIFEAVRDSRISGVVLLSGDIHRSAFLTIPGPDGGYDFPELTSSPLANRRDPCRSFPTQDDCYNADNSFVEVEVELDTVDPTVTARIRDSEGAIQAERLIRHSDLRVPE